MDENMLRMQQEAAERVREMQARARKYIESETGEEREQKTEQHNENRVTHPDQHAESLNHHEEHSRHSEPFTKHNEKSPFSFLSGFGQDQEQLLLLMLAVLLVKNNAPMELILALLYIAM